MSEPTPERPHQVTLAGWLIMVGSVVVVALVFQRVSGLHTVETREAVEDFLAKPPVSDLGVGVDGVITAIRTLAMVTAGCATAAAILGYQVLRRSRSARLALTVLAVPLFLAGLVTGGFLTSVVAASAVILWLQPARAWFDGTTPPPPRRLPAPRPGSAPTAGSTPGPTTDLTTVRRPSAPATAATGRPALVTWACVLTWVSTALTVVALIASAAVLAIDPDRMLDEVHRDNPELAAQGVSDDLLIAATYVMIVGIAVWCVAAAVVAVLVVRRVDWARIVLIVSACVAGAVCLLGAAMGAVLLIVPLFACALCVSLLLRPETRAWFAGRAR